jgi:copper(I)-binding protein
VSVRPSHARRTAALIGAPVLALSLAGCGAGLNANTYLSRNLDDAANADVGEISLRNVYVASPEQGIEIPQGDEAELLLFIANNSQTADRLVSVDTDAAGSTDIRFEGRSASSVEVPPASLIGDQLVVELSGLTRPLRAGEYLDVTMRFERAGERRVQVPVGSPNEPGEPEHSEKLHGEKEE